MNLTKEERLGLDHLIKSLVVAEQHRQRISCAMSAIQGGCWHLSEDLGKAEAAVRAAREAINRNFGTTL